MSKDGQVAQAADSAEAFSGLDGKLLFFTVLVVIVILASGQDNRLIIPLVLAVVMLVLMVLLRAALSPLLLIGTVVLSFGAALGIDYNIFLMTRVREETPQHGTLQASKIALGATGGVITSAGILLAATFLMLGTMPLVAFAEIGIAVALGVLLDTLIVRSVLVTALNLDLGSAGAVEARPGPDARVGRTTSEPVAAEK